MAATTKGISNSKVASSILKSGARILSLLYPFINFINVFNEISPLFAFALS
jgi:hypothetical protein